MYIFCLYKLGKHIYIGGILSIVSVGDDIFALYKWYAQTFYRYIEIMREREREREKEGRREIKHNGNILLSLQIHHKVRKMWDDVKN